MEPIVIFDDTFYMKEALKEAQKAYDKSEVPVGAIIVSNNRILARTHNLTETLCDPTAHAEMQAFTSATNVMGGKYLIDCTLYVTLEPCCMCAGAAYWTRISRIVYGASDPKRGYSLIQNQILHPTTQVTSGILENESSQLLKKFFKNMRDTYF